jgi:hypothetical protein
MFVTGPPTEGDRAPLGVHRAAGRTFAEVTGQVLNPTLRGYVHDMVAPYGLAARDTLIDEGRGHSYGEMCLPLLDELVPEDEPADLLVLATTVPDVRYGRSTATFLSWHCAGAPLAFTVCDQGLLAAFTALHLIEAYAHSGSSRAVLLVAEQPVVYHELPLPTPLPDRAAAVGLVLTRDGPSRLTPVRRHAGLTAHQARKVLADEMAGLSEPLVLVGAGLADVPIDGNVVVCQENQPLTGIWLDLSRLLPHAGEQILLAEYDPTLGRLFTTTLRTGQRQR